MSVQQLPLEIENIIYDYAFGFTTDVLIEGCAKDNEYLHAFLHGHSKFMIDQINWFEFLTSIIENFYKLIEKRAKISFQCTDMIINYRHTLKTFFNSIDYKIFNFNTQNLAYYYAGIRGFGGDGKYEYLLDVFPEIEDDILRIIQN